MVRPRPIALALLAAAALALAGCGNKEAIRTLGETEGIYLHVNNLVYQVQLSRQLNPGDPEDVTYIRGFANADSGTLGSDEVWFAVFILVQNPTRETHPSVREFEIVDTEENVYRPVLLDRQENAFAYQPRDLPARRQIPHPDSIPAHGPTAGELLLFKLKRDALQNRPLEFRLLDPLRGDEGARVDLDV